MGELDHQIEDVTLEFGVIIDHHIGLYIEYEAMLVNYFYNHNGYVRACHFIVVMVTCVIYAIFSMWSYEHASDSHVW